MLGNNILKLRKKLGLSQEELSEQVNVTRQTISNWELNETQPNPEQLKLLSKALNVSVDDLIDNEIKSVIEKKIDNTEKYSKMVIIMVALSLGVMILLGLFDVFYSLKHKNQEVNSVRLNCKLDDLDTSVKNIKFYFKEHNGICE